MTNDTLKLTDKEVLDYARTGLQEHLPLGAEGYQCSTCHGRIIHPFDIRGQ
jgi:hypothetical protein